METLLNILPIIQITLAVILIGAILLQQRGAGLGGAFGGSDGGVHYERRGFERTLFKGTGVIALLFVASVAISILKVNPEVTPANSDSLNTGATTTAATSSETLRINPEDIIIKTEDGKPIEGLEIIPIENKNTPAVE